VKIYFYTVPKHLAEKAFGNVPAKIQGRADYFFPPAATIRTIETLLKNLMKNDKLVDTGGGILVNMALKDHVLNVLKTLGVKTQKEESNWLKENLDLHFDPNDSHYIVHEEMTLVESFNIVKKEIHMILNGYLNYLTDQPNGIDGAIVLGEDGDPYASSNVAAGKVLGGNTDTLNLDRYSIAVKHFQLFIKDAQANFNRGIAEEATLIFSKGIIKICPYQSERLGQKFLIILVNTEGKSVLGAFNAEVKGALLEIQKCIENKVYEPTEFSGLPEDKKKEFMK